MQLLVRSATISDVPGILEIKTALTIQPDQSPHAGGGFLLDSDVERIYRHIEEDIVLVAEDTDRDCLAGFAQIFRHQTVMTDIWPRRGESVLNVSEEFLVKAKVSWFDSLGMRTGQQYRLHAPLLALRAIQLAFEEHMLIGTAIMSEPTPNINSLHLMNRSGFQSIGSVTENLPGIDGLTSDIYIVDRDTFKKAISEPKLKRVVDRLDSRENSAAQRNAAAQVSAAAM